MTVVSIVYTHTYSYIHVITFWHNTRISKCMYINKNTKVPSLVGHPHIKHYISLFTYSQKIVLCYVDMRALYEG